MTKLKSKKMAKSTFAIVIMAIAMVAMLAFGGTYAYFTATATADAGTVTTATVQLNAASEVTLTADTKILPGETIVAADKIAATNLSDAPTWVFAKIEVKATTIVDGTPTEYEGWKYEANTATANQVPFIIDGGDFTALTGDTYKGIYAVKADGTKLAGKTDAVLSIGAITFNSAIAGHSVDETTGSGMGVTVTVKVTFDAIQEIAGEAYDTAEEAYAYYLTLNRTTAI